ncbi:MAG TPA: hypothetical protein VH062_10950 [Polyangiaceae bacterium]|jgi:hypothetical protein|nr:hypothetical protein [Polyangiaceae bacterium]
MSFRSQSARHFSLAALGVATVLAACAERPAARPLARPTAGLDSRTAVLVAIDGVRWQEVFGGVEVALADQKGLDARERLDAAHLVPNLHRLMTSDGAVVGAPSSSAPMRASGPNFVSLPGYMEMLTGRRDTGCTNNACGDVPFSTIADDVADHGGTAAVVASWPGILHAATSTRGHVATSIGRHGGDDDAFKADPNVAALLHDGESAGPGPGEDDFRLDASTGELACAYLEARRPAFLFVGLGETDEYAHRGDYRAYLKALHDADTVVGRLAAVVAALNGDGHPSTLLVTTDHGRANGFSSHGGDHPESAQVWLVASGAGIRARGATTSAAPRRLSDVGQTVRRVLGLPGVEAAPAGAVLSELFTAPGASVASR